MESIRRTAAIHEAGHAVVCHALGGRVGNIEITRNGDFGTCIIRGPFSDESAAAIDYAGMVAEILLCKNHPRTPIVDRRPDIPSDTQSIAALAAGKPDPEAWKDAAIVRATHILVHNKDAVEGLASLLTRRLVVPGLDARRLLRSYKVRRVRAAPKPHAPR